jgi:ribonuclease BN (tRNA processing enzyme)
VKLTVLGSQGTWPGPGGECCGYLVSSDGFHLWLDAGTGTFARLQDEIAVNEVGGVLISHGHADHFLDMIPAFYARHYGGLGAPGLPFHSPSGFTDVCSLLVNENGRDVMGQAFGFADRKSGDIFEIGPFRVTAFEMTHIGVYSLGYRIEADGVTLAYTGDTGPCEAAVELARGADLFLCEASYQNSSELAFFHMSAEQAAQHAAAAGVDRLVLTHLVPGLDPKVSREEAAVAFDGPVDLATAGTAWVVGS